MSTMTEQTEPTQPTLSRWFSVDDDGQPALPGYYDVAYGPNQRTAGTRRRMYWNGEAWTYGHDTESRCAYGNRGTSGEYWRGLASDPKAVQP